MLAENDIMSFSHTEYPIIESSSKAVEPGATLISQFLSATLQPVLQRTKAATHRMSPTL